MGKRKKNRKKFWDTKFGRGLKKVGHEVAEYVNFMNEVVNAVVEFALVGPILRPAYNFWKKHDHTVLPALTKAAKATGDWIYENRKYTYPILITGAVVVVVGTAGYAAYGAYAAAETGAAVAEGVAAGAGEAAVVAAEADAKIAAEVVAADAKIAAQAAAADAKIAVQAAADAKIAGQAATVDAKIAAQAAADAKIVTQAAAADAKIAAQAAAADAKIAAESATVDAKIAGQAATDAKIAAQAATDAKIAGQAAADAKIAGQAATDAKIAAQATSDAKIAAQAATVDAKIAAQAAADARIAAQAAAKEAASVAAKDVYETGQFLQHCDPGTHFVVVQKSCVPDVISCSRLLSPSDGANIPPVGKQTFLWTSIAEAGSYVQKITLPSGETLSYETNQTLKDFYMEAFIAGGEYKWQIVAQDSDGSEICSSEVYSFEKADKPTASGGSGSDGGGGGSGGGGGACLPPAPCP
jgi:hypothetical protein